MPETETNEYIFVHECEQDGCTNRVQYDDEPWCFTHSPDEGSSLRGYSARAKAFQKTLLPGEKEFLYKVLERANAFQYNQSVEDIAMRAKLLERLEDSPI